MKIDLKKDLLVELPKSNTTSSKPGPISFSVSRAKTDSNTGKTSNYRLVFEEDIRCDGTSKMRARHAG